MTHQLPLGITGEQRLSRHQALQMILFRLDENGKPLPRDKEANRHTPAAAFLIGWKDEPGDPVFVSVGEPGRSPKEHVALRVATEYMSKRLELDIEDPCFVIPPFDGRII